MTLHQLFKRDEWTEARLARLVGCHQSTINRLRRKKRRAGLALALSIESATDGLVRAERVPMTPEGRASLRIIRSGDHLQTNGAAA